MSYITIRIYSFECDDPGCDEVIESSTGLLLADALAEITEPVYGWTVKTVRERDLLGRARRVRKQFCPKHKPEGNDR